MNTTVTQAIAPTQTHLPAKVKAMIGKDIRAKWDKFSESDVTAPKNKDELVTQVVAKYGTEKVQAGRDVDAVLNGRLFS